MCKEHACRYSHCEITCELTCEFTCTMVPSRPASTTSLQMSPASDPYIPPAPSSPMIYSYKCEEWTYTGGPFPLGFLFPVIIPSQSPSLPTAPKDPHQKAVNSNLAQQILMSQSAELSIFRIYSLRVPLKGAYYKQATLRKQLPRRQTCLCLSLRSGSSSPPGRDRHGTNKHKWVRGIVPSFFRRK